MNKEHDFHDFLLFGGVACFSKACAFCLFEILFISKQAIFVKQKYAPEQSIAQEHLPSLFTFALVRDLLMPA